MTFDEVLDQARELLQSKGRVAYRALKRRFELEDEYLEDLKAELIDAEHVACDKDGKVLVWTGGEGTGESENRRIGASQTSPQSPTPNTQPLSPNTQPLAAERRQLTVMFCDLVGSTALSERLDPEELREVVRLYQETCATVVQRYAGHIAQHLGDGLLVYFGYPVAHEDDAQRAVRAGLEIIAALREQAPENRPQGRLGSFQVRIGIHTGLVVIGEIGSSAKHEILALGETPNLAARVQGVAAPDTVVISAATQRLVQGLFEYQDLGPQTLKGISSPQTVHRVIGENATQSRFEVAVGRGLTPLVGREEELGLLRRRWEQAKTGAGQVVLLSGEPGIGKSRLVQALKEQVGAEGATRIEFRCSPYHQNSAFYPIIGHLQRLLQVAHDDTPEEKLKKLEYVLTRRGEGTSPLQTETLALLAALLSLPHPVGSPPLTMSPQRQKQKTQEALVAWLIKEAEKTPLHCAWEDLHWADPSTLEVLTLLLDQAPTTRLLALLTFRPEFTPPWSPRSYLSQLTLSRLGRPHVEAMVAQVPGARTLPAEVVQQIVAKTDGVPLFVEELTKSVAESVGARLLSLSKDVPLPLGIPVTLHDALMARLDRLGPARAIAQLGATIGREFSYDLLHAVSLVDEGSLQQGLRQLVEVELLYQRGLPPQATYLFKHALIQDTAYQSLLKSRRQQLHQQIAQILEERFAETLETQPELLDHHYTEAGLAEQAIPQWQKAGQKAAQRSANAEAIAHLTKGLELLRTMPDSSERVQQELALQIALGTSLTATKGYAASEVERACNRVRELYRHGSEIEISQLFQIMRGLWGFSMQRAEIQPARELSEQLLTLAQSTQDTALLLVAHYSYGCNLFYLGALSLARGHLEQGITLYNPQQHHPLTFLYRGSDSGMACCALTAYSSWLLGYPEQALKGILEALALAQRLSHPFSIVWALSFVARLHYLRREGQAAQEWAEAVITRSGKEEFPYWQAVGTILRGWALAEQGNSAEGIPLIQGGLAAHRATGSKLDRPYYLAMLADAYGKRSQMEEGLQAVTEALTEIDRSEERFYEAELYRLKGELLLQQARQQKH